MLVIDKSSGVTSHDVVSMLRKRLGERRIGHAGTLDPSATGVLIIGVGKATRLMRFATASAKTYETEIVFGAETDTLDADGEVVLRHKMSFSGDDLLNAAMKFLGEINQIPPMVSALKVGGRRLHELAREGIEIEREARKVRIDRFDLTPTESQPVVLTELQILPTALDITNNLMLENSESSQKNSSRINRIYRSTALDQPVIVARDEPISKLNPNQFGLFAPVPSKEEIGIEEIISDLIPRKNSVDDNIQANFPKVSKDIPPVVTLITSKEAWIEIISADGSVIYKNLMQPGSEFALPQTEKPPTLLAGMSGYVYLAIDGILYGPAGKGVNVVKNVTLDPKSILASYKPAQYKSDPDLQKLVADAKFSSFNTNAND